MLAPLQHRRFRLFWTGTVISQFGDFALFVALPFDVYILTGSVLSTGLIFVVETVPRVVLAPLAGVLVDRWDRRQLLVSTNLLQAVVVLGLLAVHGRSDLWIVYVVAALESVGATFVAPAAGAMVPSIVDPEGLPAANALEALGIDVARLAGPPAGGLLFGAGGLELVVAVDAVTFGAAVVAAWVMGAAPGDRAAAESGDEAPTGGLIRRIAQEMESGMSIVRRATTLRAVFCVLAAVFVGQGILSVMIVPLVRHHLGGSSTDLGVLLGGQAVGGLLGGVVVGNLRLRPEWLVAGGCLGIAAAIGGLGNSPALVVGVLCMGVAGVAAVGVLIGVSTILQTATPATHLGRVFSLFSAWLAGFTLVGIGLATGLGGALGPIRLLDIAAVVFGLGGLLQLGMGRRKPESGQLEEPAT
jgi:predicted MFS family arabinose efflux permease